MPDQTDRTKPASRPLTPVEQEQRRKLRERLTGRPRPTREQLREMGAPMLDETDNLRTDEVWLIESKDRDVVP